MGFVRLISVLPSGEYVLHEKSISRHFPDGRVVLLLGYMARESRRRGPVEFHDISRRVSHSAGSPAEESCINIESPIISKIILVQHARGRVKKMAYITLLA